MPSLLFLKKWQNFKLSSAAKYRWCFIPLILTGSKDWEWWDESVPDKLKDLDKNNYRVVFFTNQAGIEKMKVSEEEIKIKIEHMIKELGIPIYVSLRHIHVSPYSENKYFECKIMIIFL